MLFRTHSCPLAVLMMISIKLLLQFALAKNKQRYQSFTNSSGYVTMTKLQLLLRHVWPIVLDSWTKTIAFSLILCHFLTIGNSIFLDKQTDSHAVMLSVKSLQTGSGMTCAINHFYFESQLPQIRRIVQ